MRISTAMIYAKFNSDLQGTMEQIYKADEKISSGKKVNRASDNPAAMSSIISGKAQLMAFEAYQGAMTNANLLLNATDTSLGSLEELIASAKQIATSTSSDSYSTDAEMMNNLIKSVIGIGNTQVNGRYIFSGYASDEPAIDTTTGMFLGTSDRIAMEINTGTRVDVNITGDELIAYGPVSATSANSGLINAASSDSALITASDGITSSGAMYSANGGTLNISLGGTAYSVAITAGASLADVSAAINTATGTTVASVIDANNGVSPADYKIMLSATLPLTADDISVAVTTTDAAGTGLNRLATSAMNSVFSVNGGTFDISLGGGAATTVTINPGATWSDVTAAINASGTGVRAEALNANPAGTPPDYRLMLSASPEWTAADISVTGITTTDTAGTGLNRVATGAGMTSVVSPDKTIIGAMSILKTAIENGDKPAIQRALSDLQDLSTTAIQKQSDVGLRMNRIVLEKSYLTARDTDVTNSVADKLTLTEVELASLITQVQQKQTSLEALRSMSSEFLKTSLFDYL
jgi:flagellar hook-associated protein 3 FlgL